MIQYDERHMMWDRSLWKPPGKKQLKGKKGHEDQMTETLLLSFVFRILPGIFVTSWIKATKISRGKRSEGYYSFLTGSFRRWYGLNLASQVEVTCCEALGKRTEYNHSFWMGNRLLFGFSWSDGAPCDFL